MLLNDKIETAEHYNLSVERYEQLKGALIGSEAHSEKMRLVESIQKYENGLWNLPDISDEEMKKIRLSDFGYSGD